MSTRMRAATRPAGPDGCARSVGCSPTSHRPPPACAVVPNYRHPNRRTPGREPGRRVPWLGIVPVGTTEVPCRGSTWNCQFVSGPLRLTTPMTCVVSQCSRGRSRWSSALGTRRGCSHAVNPGGVSTGLQRDFTRSPALTNKPGTSVVRRQESHGEALENQWNSAAVRHYRAVEPSRLVKDVPLYTL